MNLERSCEKGKIKLNEFSTLLCMKSRRTHLLNPGDYVVFTNWDKGDFLATEKIDKLDFPEKGKFVTVRGSIGPISGNIFIKINKEKFPKCLLIEGGRIGSQFCPTPVYDLLREYRKKIYG